MRSKNRLSVWLGAGLLMLLCHAGAAFAQQGLVDVKGNGTLGVTGVAFVPPGCSVGDNPCEANLNLTGKGFSNFTGPITVSAIEHVNLGVVVPLLGQGPSPLCFPAALDANETAANGDTLEIIAAGNACFNGSDSVAFNGSWAIGVGSTGTGKFANALGTGTRVLVVDLTNRGIFTDTGAIQLKH
jgi:hypothetical protein